MSGATDALTWHDERMVYGFNVKVLFFDGDAAEKEPDFVRRMLPMFRTASPRVIAREKDRRNFRVSTVVAQPDAVLEHGRGLLSLEYKPQGRKRHRRDRWPEDIPVSGMLQCMIGAVAVASELGKPAVPILRCHNAVYLLRPHPDVLIKVLETFPLALTYWRDSPNVSSSRVAKLCEPWVRDRYPDTSNESLERQRQGEELHAMNL